VAGSGRTLLAWGDNSHGQLGDGTTVSRFRPAPVRLDLPSGVTVAAIGAGAVHSIALTSEPLVLTWGGNAFGQVGDHSKTDRTLPVQPNLFEVINGVRQPERVTVIGTGPASMNSFAAVPPKP
jgi:alpha-tubulin suppressor-like RCC1 family protein